MERILAFTKAWAKERGVDHWPYTYRASFVALTESGGGRQYANDGKAFHPDPEQRRPGWGEKLTPEQRQKVYEVLRTSLDYPHDAVGNNGGSTGWAQGLSDDYLTALRGTPTSFGWGTIAQQLDPDTGVEFIARAFLDRVRITDDKVYSYVVDGKTKKLKTASPIIADTLRVQQPKPAESESDNYGASNLELLKFRLDNWHPRYFTDGGK